MDGGVPRSTIGSFLHRRCVSCACLITCVDEVVGVAVAQGPADDEWALPWRGQLVLAGLLLDESEDEVALMEREGLNLLAVVVPQALLVDGRATERQETCFFEQVDADNPQV